MSPFLAVLLGAAVAAAPADRIFVNGRLWTGDAARPRVEALAISGDRIVAVGSAKDVLRHRGPQTEVVDLKGRFACPGFNDAHLHFLVLETVDLADVYDLVEIQR